MLTIGYCIDRLLAAVSPLQRTRTPRWPSQAHTYVLQRLARLNHLNILMFLDIPGRSRAAISIVLLLLDVVCALPVPCA